MRFAARHVPGWGSSLCRASTRRHILATLVVVFAACVGAVLAHIVIDLLGDVLLVRDAYDNQAHASRFIALDVAMFGGLGIAWHIVASAFAEARDGNRFLRAAAEDIVAGPAWSFIGRTTLTTVAILALMGGIDAQLDSIRLDDLSDLFGGSSVLGLAVSIPLGAGVGTAVFGLMRWIAIAQRTIVAAVIALLSLIVRARQAPVQPRQMERICSSRRSFSALARRARKRAPPPLFA